MLGIDNEFIAKYANCALEGRHVNIIFQKQV